VKIIQISDTHIVPPGAKLHGLEPCRRLDACIDAIAAQHGDASFCVVTGDLTERGDAQSYAALRQRLERLPFPYHLLIGNHDRRDVFLKCFPEFAFEPDGFAQSMLECDIGFCLFLDSHTPGESWGSFCEQRADWLAARLAETAGNPVYLFLHHPPFDIGIPGLDAIRLRDPGNLVAAMSGHDNLRHLFLGHVHCPVSGSWRGLPYSALRSTAHQVTTDEKSSRLGYLDLAGQYAVIRLLADVTSVRLESVQADR
jgi:3',5'-cyclic AMP phosphodiesterase CpdA